MNINYTREQRLEGMILLRQIKEVLSNSSKRTKNWFAVDAEGNRCSSNDPKAVAWDFLGALLKLGHSAKDPASVDVATNFLISRIMESAENGDSDPEEKALPVAIEALEKFAALGL